MESFFIVSTPIGNLEDITFRAIKILNLVDFIICEDTRVTTKLLQKYSISKPLMVYNDFSGENVRNKIISKLLEGKKAALVSDAGTPLISDPGFKLIRTIKEHNIKITSIPGASSVMTALTLGAMPTDQFLFTGYLAPKTTQRKKELVGFANFTGTLVTLETARRLLATLTDILEIFGNRRVSIARELTKLHEEIITDDIAALIEKYNKEKARGEIVLLIEGFKSAEVKQEIILKEIKDLSENYSTKDLVLKLSEKYKLSKKYLYDLAKNN